jgi:predicted RNA binding protein YcfA (HicA-like mRNA interferase family)
MVRDHLYAKIPNPHHGEDIGAGLLAEILRRAKISREEWHLAG